MTSRLDLLKRQLQTILIDYSHTELADSLEALFAEQYARLAHWDNKRSIPIDTVKVIELEEVLDPVVPAVVKAKKVPKKVQVQEVIQEVPAVEKSKHELHKEKIVAKAAELKKNNIDGREMLSEPALKAWIEIQGKSYWDVAEMTGVFDAEISARCKSYGIQSKVSKLAFQKRQEKAAGNP
jgi:hypothetical protein